MGIKHPVFPGGGGKRGTWAAFARKATLSPSTVSNFCSGQTKRPTVRRLLDAAGYELTWKKRGRR
jgi:hypothetical protein